jgi:hypothetical protein
MAGLRGAATPLHSPGRPSPPFKSPIVHDRYRLGLPDVHPWRGAMDTTPPRDGTWLLETRGRGKKVLVRDPLPPVHWDRCEPEYPPIPPARPVRAKQIAAAIGAS